ncbi:MAG TPA: hybrid sensor histidine kinase/response regulator [Bacteroidales bacterium]|nr:hybrid sensor histidine kinase/response regulator [Bacteroidales bacterium]
MVDTNSLQLRSRGNVLRVLIIEDNPGDIIIIRELLKATGTCFTLQNAITLREAISFLNSDSYDIILLDLGLPDSSGIETLKEFLQFDISPPVIVMTGLDDEDTALASLRQGAQDYLVKNRLNSENILRSIKYSIERKNVQLLQKKKSHQLSILSGATSSLYEGDEVSAIYTIICDSIRNLVSKTIVLSIEFDNKDSFYFSNTKQLNIWDEQIRMLTGVVIAEMKFAVSDQKSEIVKLFMDGRIHNIPGGLCDLFGDLEKEETCIKLQKMMGIKVVYAIGFLRNDLYYGGILIFSPDEIEDDDQKFIENICSQASLSIHRRIIQKNLSLSEAKYQKLAGELEEKVRERTKELEIANSQLRKSEAQLKELNATKDKFFNIVAHDLKNPFTSLLGATELLFHNIQNMDYEKIKKLAQILNESAKSGYAILLNLLDWSRSQTGTIKIYFQMVNLKKVIEDNIAELYLNSLDKQITMTSDVHEDINFIADKNMLNTILRNLLSNAIKFTQRGGSVCIKGEIKENTIYVSVRDNGIGISKDNIDKLFRIDSKYSRPGTEKEIGTGLGLKLSKEFVEKLGGKIWVESAENHGSNFTFSLPLQDAAVEARNT